MAHFTPDAGLHQVSGDEGQRGKQCWPAGVRKERLDLLRLRAVPPGSWLPNPAEGRECGGAVTADRAVESDALSLAGCQRAADDGSLWGVCHTEETLVIELPAHRTDEIQYAINNK